MSATLKSIVWTSLFFFSAFGQELYRCNLCKEGAGTVVDKLKNGCAADGFWTGDQIHLGADGLDALDSSTVVPVSATNSEAYLSVNFKKDHCAANPKKTLQFWSPLRNGVDEAVLRYQVHFYDTFNFLKGGKLPGLAGGLTKDDRKMCSGEKDECKKYSIRYAKFEDKNQCFSARLMFREFGFGEVYFYLPNNGNPPSTAAPQTTRFYSQLKTKNDKSSSYMRGSIGFNSTTAATVSTTSGWYQVTQYIKMNTFDFAGTPLQNGVIETYVGDSSVPGIFGYDVVYRTDMAKHNYGITHLFFSTFYGGGESYYCDSNSDNHAAFRAINVNQGPIIDASVGYTAVSPTTVTPLAKNVKKSCVLSCNVVNVAKMQGKFVGKAFDCSIKSNSATTSSSAATFTIAFEKDTKVIYQKPSLNYALSYQSGLAFRKTHNFKLTKSGTFPPNAGAAEIAFRIIANGQYHDPNYLSTAFCQMA